MRRDYNFEVFATHYDWFTVVKGIGYVPTDKAPAEAVEAMKRFNAYMAAKHKAELEEEEEEEEE